MASLYTRAADRKRLAPGAMHMLANELQHLFPHLTDKVRAHDAKS